MPTKQYAVVTIANHCTPVELVGKPTIKVRPLEGHMGDGREPEMVIDYRHFDTEGIANIGGRAILVQPIGKPTIKVRPLEGHMGDGREPEVEVDWLHILIVANESDAQKIANMTNSHVKELKAS